MAKYTIETDGNTTDDISGYLGIRIEICNKRTWVKTDIELTPYTEPDLVAIRREAFEKGYSTAVAEQECAVRGAAEKGYQKGLSDVWEAARKIALMDTETSENVTGYFGLFRIMENLTPMQAIEKIRKYEQEKDRQARIEYNFDEIKDVLETTAKECNVSLDEIAEVLQKMKEDSNG